MSIFTKATGGTYAKHVAPPGTSLRPRGVATCRDAVMDRSRAEGLNQRRSSRVEKLVSHSNERPVTGTVATQGLGAADPVAVTRPARDDLDRWRRWRDAAKELCLVGVLYGLYRLGRQLAVAQESLARANAEVVHAFESHLSLPSGMAIQGWFSDDALRLANMYYVSAHFPVTIAVLVWGFSVRSRDEYVWARSLLATQTFLALILHIVIPLAPPRMFPEWGFRDTMATIGPSAYEGASAAVSNQFAAMPSLHVGWAVLVAVVIARTAARPLRVLAGTHAVITSLVVIVTANHWWIDGVVALALLGIALYVFPGPGRRAPTGSSGSHAASDGAGRPRARFPIWQRDGPLLRRYRLNFTSGSVGSGGPVRVCRRDLGLRHHWAGRASASPWRGLGAL